MEFLPFFLFFFIFIVVVPFANSAVHRRKANVLKQTAERLGLELDDSQKGQPPRFQGDRLGQHIQLETFASGNHYTLDVSPTGLFHHQITVHARKLMNPILFARPQFQTGDAVFDEQAVITWGDEAGVIALLNEKARQTFCEIVNIVNTFDVNQYRISVVISGAELRARGDRVATLLTELSCQLSREGTVREMLERNVLEDSNDPFRQRSLELLFRMDQASAGTSARPSAEIRSFLQKLLKDRDWRIRLQAAQALGWEGVVAFCEQVLEEPALLRQEVVEAVSELNKSETGPMLREAVRRQVGLEAAAAALGRLKDTGSFELLVQTYAETRRRRERVAIIAALEQLADERANDFLLELLSRPDLESDVRLGVIRALGTCGTVQAVEALWPMMERVLGGEHKAAARQSIAQIQARLGTVERGWVSISDSRAPEGTLSLATGAMSANHQQGALSATQGTAPSNQPGSVFSPHNTTRTSDVSDVSDVSNASDEAASNAERHESLRDLEIERPEPSKG